jgi:hypothetical protein
LGLAGEKDFGENSVRVVPDWNRISWVIYHNGLVKSRLTGQHAADASLRIEPVHVNVGLHTTLPENAGTDSKKPASRPASPQGEFQRTNDELLTAVPGQPELPAANKSNVRG